MPIDARLAAAALAALSCGAALLSSEARADPPLMGLPYLYDADGKLIGPYLPSTASPNSVLMRIDGRFVAVSASTLGFRDSGYTLYYKKPNCLGAAFMTGNTLPFAGALGDTLYYPAAARETMTMKGRKVFATGATSATCEPLQYEAFFSKLTTVKTTTFGFTAPFELRASAPN